MASRFLEEWEGKEKEGESKNKNLGEKKGEHVKSGKVTDESVHGEGSE